MKAHSRQYLFAFVFVALAVYELVKNDLSEFSLYALAGGAFILNALSMEPWLSRYRKPLVIFCWILIGATGILFLYLLQFKYL